MQDIYLGRIVAAGMTVEGKLTALYRVSSRSFPNRKAVINKDVVSIVPKEGHEGDIFKNPYIAYNCAKIINNETAILTNGSHTDPIAEKIASGMNIRDALIYSLAVTDYEKDAYDTPRIAAIVRKGEKFGWLGTIRRDGMEIRSFELQKGRCFYLSTYEHSSPLPERCASLNASDAAGACVCALGQDEFAHFLNPVTAVCAVENSTGFTLAAQDML